MSEKDHLQRHTDHKLNAPSPAVLPPSNTNSAVIPQELNHPLASLTVAQNSFESSRSHHHGFEIDTLFNKLGRGPTHLKDFLQAHKYSTSAAIASTLGLSLDILIRGVTSPPKSGSNWGIGVGLSLAESYVAANLALLASELKVWDTLQANSKKRQEKADEAETTRLLSGTCPDHCIEGCDWEQKGEDDDLWLVGGGVVATLLPAIATFLTAKTLESHYGMGSKDAFEYAFAAMEGLLVAGAAVTAFHAPQLNSEEHDHDHHSQHDHHNHYDHHHADTAHNRHSHHGDHERVEQQSTLQAPPRIFSTTVSLEDPGNVQHPQLPPQHFHHQNNSEHVTLYNRIPASIATLSAQVHLRRSVGNNSEMDIEMRPVNPVRASVRSNEVHVGTAPDQGKKA